MARKHDRYDGQRVGFAENARDLAKQHPRGSNELPLGLGKKGSYRQ
jgi:hypothetical protein